jgi:PAS domain S-box-containing protein
MAILTPIVKRMAELVIDRYVFRGRYNYQKDLKALSRHLSDLHSVDVVTESVIELLLRTMRIKKGRLILLDEPMKGDARFAGERTKLGPIIRQLEGEAEVLVRYELKKRNLGVDQGVLTCFDELEAVLVVPLIVQGELLGMIALGEKISGDVYSVEDIDFLSTFGNQVAVATKNAMLYREILEVKDYNEKILEQMASGVITIDSELRVATFNRRASALIGIAASEALGRYIGEVNELLAERLEETLRLESSVANTELVLLTEGVSLPINVSTSLLREPSGEVIGALAVFTDLTEIKQLEAEVRRAERLATVGTLAAGMAHEIKNPLVSLKTFAQLLPTKYNDPDFRDYFSKIATQEVERINSLVEQLLRFARPSKPIFLPMDVHQPVEETLALLGSDLAKRGIEVVRRLTDEEVTVFADNEQLKQVLLNLVLNAMDAVEEGEVRRLTIRTTVYSRGRPRQQPGFKLPDGFSFAGKEVVLSISDSGPGIPDEHIKHIFDPFFTTKDQGHGLGLSIAHGIIREHMGAVAVFSRPGEGTTFNLSFPLIHALRAEEKEAQDEVRLDRLA